MTPPIDRTRQRKATDSEIGELLAELADVRRQTDEAIEDIKRDMGERYDRLLAHIVRIEQWFEDLAEEKRALRDAVSTGEHEVEGLARLVEQHSGELARIHEAHKKALTDAIKDQQKRDRAITAVVTAVALAIQHLLAGGTIPFLGG